MLIKIVNFQPITSLFKMEIAKDFPRYKSGSDFFNTDDDELVNLQFQSGDENLKTRSHEEKKVKKKSKI